MELNIFMHELKKALVERGIPEETAAKHVSNLSRSFTNDDLSEINAIRSYEEVQQLADSISVILSKGRSSQQQNPPPAPEQIPPVATPSDRLEAKEVAVKPQARQAPRQRHQPKAEEDSYFEYSPENTPSTKGMLIFWVGLFLTLPITLGLAAVIFGAFAAVFVGLAGLIVAGVVALVAVVAAGAGISLVGIIFGITQLFSFVAAGNLRDRAGRYGCRSCAVCGGSHLQFVHQILPVAHHPGRKLHGICLRKTKGFVLKRQKGVL